MTRDLEGKIAVITGSSQGIGRAVARAFIESSAQVVANSPNEDDTEAAARALGDKAVGIAAAGRPLEPSMAFEASAETIREQSCSS
jgi:NAD(P)-dependent dehydrogenase (short-subunit alcohol dehydrogenase family)